MSVLALAVATLLLQSPQAARDWGAALRTDAIAMHDAIAANHPGPVNPADPGFEARNDKQLTRALDRARTAKSFADYFYALQEYAASFNDGHLGYGVWGATPDDVRRWPGFLTKYDGNGHQTVFVSEPWSGVPLGARLVSCDGHAADEVARNRIGSRFGRWNLAAQRQLFGAMTFLDTGDPYVAPIHRCRFRKDGKTIEAALQWRPPVENLDRKYVFSAARKTDIDWERLKDGTYWFSIPSFNGDPNSTTGQKLGELIAYIGAHAHDIRAAPAIVFDLRGNDGGSSDWSHQIARELWGEGAIASHPEPPMTISWRASTDNLASISQTFAERSKGGHLSPEVTSWYKDTVSGLGKAIAAGDALWVIKPQPTDTDANAPVLPTYSLNGPVYVVTDASCMSACLDPVDLWTRLGAITVGRETGADTLYMEVRLVRLPAGVGGFSLPMKVYSGRSRGSNQPVTPRFRFNGDMTNTAALQTWIATLQKNASKH